MRGTLRKIKPAAYAMSRWLPVDKPSLSALVDEINTQSPHLLSSLCPLEWMARTLCDEEGQSRGQNIGLRLQEGLQEPGCT